jgi:hypothetical protein
LDRGESDLSDDVRVSESKNPFDLVEGDGFRDANEVLIVSGALPTKIFDKKMLE